METRGLALALGVLLVFLCLLHCPPSAGAEPRDIALVVANPLDFDRVGEPVTCGVPLAKGLATAATDLRLFGPAETEIPEELRPDQDLGHVLRERRGLPEGARGEAMTPTLRHGEGLLDGWKR